MTTPAHEPASGSDVLSRLHRAFNERDAATMRSLLAEDVTWHTPGNHPMAGTCAGRDEVWDNYIAPIWNSPARIEDHGSLSHPDHEHGAVLLSVIHDFGDGDVRLSGIEVARVRNGRIVERWVFDEDQDAVDRLITTAMSERSKTP